MCSGFASAPSWVTASWSCIDGAPAANCSPASGCPPRSGLAEGVRPERRGRSRHPLRADVRQADVEFVDVRLHQRHHGLHPGLQTGCHLLAGPAQQVADPLQGLFRSGAHARHAHVVQVGALARDLALHVLRQAGAFTVNALQQPVVLPDDLRLRGCLDRRGRRAEEVVQLLAQAAVHGVRPPPAGR